MTSQRFSVQQFSPSQESEVFRLIVDGEAIHDIADLTGGATPLTNLLTKEESESLSSLNDEERQIRRESISALVSWLFKPVQGKIPLPRETAIRLWLLVYSLCPQLINGLSLSQIGALFDGKPLSRATLSKRSISLDEQLGLHARNRKSPDAVEKYREATKANHCARIEAERAEARRLYNLAYKRKHRDRISAMNRAYYQEHKKRLLAAQVKRRAGL